MQAHKLTPDDFRNSPAGRLVYTRAGHWSFLPNPLPPQLSWKPELLAALSAADRALGELAGMLRSLPGPDLLSRLFISREAVLSSRIEGIQVSLSDLYVSEAFLVPFLDQVSRVNEVRNYIRALV